MNLKDLDRLAVDWDEDRTTFAPELVLCGFNPQPLFPGVETVDRFSEYEGLRFVDRFSERDEWGYRHVWCRRGQWMPIADGRRNGKVYFTEDVSIPTLYQHHPSNVWMSFGPMEFMTQRPGLERARAAAKVRQIQRCAACGETCDYLSARCPDCKSTHLARDTEVRGARVLVGGYGMGWFVDKLAAMPEVESICLVEESGVLLDMFAERISRTEKLTCALNDDVYHVMRQYEKHPPVALADVYLLDIWKGYGECWQDSQFIEWKEKLGGRLWGWGEENRS